MLKRKISVHLFEDNKIYNPSKIRTIGVTQKNFELINNDLPEIKNISHPIKKIIVFNHSNTEKILNFEEKNKFEMLSAYVDGELNEAETAEILEMLKSDSELRQRLQKYSSISGLINFDLLDKAETSNDLLARIFRMPNEDAPDENPADDIYVAVMGAGSNTANEFVGASVFVKLCAFGQHVISREMSSQMMNIFGEIPKATLVAAVGGGSSSFGFFCDFIDHDQISMRGVEAGGPENDDKLHAAPLTNDSPIGILHGAKQYVIQSPDGQIQKTSSIAAGLDYPGVSPMHCYLKDEGRVTYTSASDEEAVKGFEILAKTEGIQCSIEPAHAIADICRIAPKMGKDENSVVDEKLKVHGIENLRVIDASIMPEMVSGNTYAATNMIAEKGSDLILNSIN